MKKEEEKMATLKDKKQPDDRIKMDKFLTKVRGYRKKMDKKIQQKKEELKKTMKTKKNINNKLMIWKIY